MKRCNLALLLLACVALMVPLTGYAGSLGPSGNLAGDRMDATKWWGLESAREIRGATVTQSADTSPPTNVQVIAPAAGGALIGLATLAATAQDDSGTIATLEFYLDAELTPVCVDATSKAAGALFQCTWDTTTRPRGPHTVTVKAYDPSGNSALSAPVPCSVLAWQAMGLETETVVALGVTPTTAPTLYAATQSGFFQSINGGIWQRNTYTGSWPSSAVTAIAIDPLTPTTLYTGTDDDGVYRSTDGGWIWTKTEGWGWMGFSPNIESLAVTPLPPSTVYVGTAYVSRWVRAGVYESADGGTNWNALGDVFSAHVYALAIDPLTPATVYAGTGDGVYRSANGGATWTASNSGLPTATRVNALAVDPGNPATVYAGTEVSGVYRSTDGGTTWAASNSGLPTATRVNALAVDPGNPATVYAGTEVSGVYRSTNGGTTWAASNSGLTNVNVQVLAINPANPTTLYAGTAGGVFALKTVTHRPASAGVFRPAEGSFYVDYNGSGTWHGCGTDRCLQIGLLNDVPLVGDWNGTGTSKVGVFRPSDSTFYLDANGNGQWDGCGTDRCLQIGLLNDVPLVGDWNGTGTSKVGVFRPSDSTFYLDANGNGQWDGCGTDRCLQIGVDGDVPLVGDWDGTGATKVGTFRPSDGNVYLDANGNGQWDGCGVDTCVRIGFAGDIPVVGDWNGSGSSKVGVFRPSTGMFYLDYNGNGIWEGCETDKCPRIGRNSDIPLVGDWNGSGSSKVGLFGPSDGTFYLDYNGNGTWDGCGLDKCVSIGMTGDVPLVGKW